MPIRAPRLVAILLISLHAGAGLAQESVCFGTPGRGRIEGAVQLPASGRNFSAYSDAGRLLGRTWVHSKARDVIVAAYAALERSAPGKVFVYGETGWKEGGRIKPHRTHQNGLSVDFMVPILDGEGRSVPLPTGPTNKFGYAIEFDSDGRFGQSTIDFESLAEHLFQLDSAARASGIGIAQVIFDPPLLRRLFRTRRGPYLRAKVAFLPRRAWVRHDEHYHVDFRVACARSRS